MKYFIVSFLVFVATGARAGEFFEKDGFALGGYDPVSYFENSAPKRGEPTISTTFKGSTFLFSSESHKSDFLKNPEKFSPQFNGFCAFGVAGGYKAKIEPEAYTVVNAKLYLNYDLSIRKKWLQNRDSLIKKAEGNWPTVKSASTVY